LPGAIKLILLLPLFFTPQVRGGSIPLSPQAERAMREAENLSLLKDRLPACTALIRTIKKTDKSDQKVLKEKLSQLARYFYTDKGFQNFLEGKDLFEKQKFSDALEKFVEADDLENGNIEILHYRILSQVWLKQVAAADTLLERALQIDPFDMEVLRDKLLLSVTSERWEEAVSESEALISSGGDTTSSTLLNRAIALSETGEKGESVKLLNQIISKDSTLPEAQYWFAVITNTTKNISNYLDLCEKKPIKFVSRDPATCSHITDAQKRFAPPAKTLKESL
jgi:tetratricopeptide (TPR) repeat protein